MKQIFKNKKTLIITILLTLLLAGCTGIGGSGERTGKSSSEGLAIKFLTNQPPSRVPADQEFPILMEVENLGNYNVPPGEFGALITGFSKGVIETAQAKGVEREVSLSGDLLGKRDAPQGDRQLLDFGNLKGKTLSGDNYPFTVLATMCYKYETETAANVCIDPNPFSTGSERKICTSGQVSIGTQGAPITVSSIQSQPRTGQTDFTITINNAGGGLVWDQKETIQTCLGLGAGTPGRTPGLQYQDENKVTITAVQIDSGEDIRQQCSGINKETGDLILVGGTGQFRCTAQTTGTTAYTGQISIKLKYGYKTETSTRVELFKTN